MTTLDAQHRSARRDGWLLGLVVASALGLISVELFRFLEQPLAGWDWLAHDRNHHYVLAQRLAVDLAKTELAHGVTYPSHEED